jgi:alkylation response protein AidB-like acyl-CoA dehydrogenase
MNAKLAELLALATDVTWSASFSDRSALRAFELAIAFAQQRQAFAKPIAQHQAIAFKLAEMGTKVVAAHPLMVLAARREDKGNRAT